MTKGKQTADDGAKGTVMSPSKLSPKQRRIWLVGSSLVLVLLIAIGIVVAVGHKAASPSVKPLAGSAPSVSDLQQQIAKHSKSTAATDKLKLANDYTQLGDSYLSKGSTAQATSTYNQALQAAPDDVATQVGVYKGLANVAINTGDKQTAITYLNKLITISQNSQDVSIRNAVDIYQVEINYLQGATP